MPLSETCLGNTMAIYLSVSNVCTLVDKARPELGQPERLKLFGSAVYGEYQLILRNIVLFSLVFMNMDTLTAHNISFKLNLK